MKKNVLVTRVRSSWSGLHWAVEIPSDIVPTPSILRQHGYRKTRNRFRFQVNKKRKEIFTVLVWLFKTKISPAVLINTKPFNSTKYWNETNLLSWLLEFWSTVKSNSNTILITIWMKLNWRLVAKRSFFYLLGHLDLFQRYCCGWLQMSRLNWYQKWLIQAFLAN